MDGEIMNKVLIDTLLFGKTEGLGKKKTCAFVTVKINPKLLKIREYFKYYTNHKLYY